MNPIDPKQVDTLMLARWLLLLLREGPVQPEENKRQGVSLLAAGGDREHALRAMQDCSCALLEFSSILHQQKLFLSRGIASELVACVDVICGSYSYLANFFPSRKLAVYHMEPTLHVFKHVGLRLEEALNRDAPVIFSPASFLCEMGEDWIGLVSRITRRVHARTCGKRTIQRYLIKTHLEWEKLGI